MIKHFKDSKEILLYLQSNPIWISAFANGEGCFTASLQCYLKGMWGLQPQCFATLTSLSMVKRIFCNSAILSRYSLSKEDKAQISNNIPPEIQQIITGMLLGDATIIINGHQGCLRIKQKDEGFVWHLYNILKPLGIVGVQPKSHSSIIKPSGNIRTAYYFTTVTLPFFTELHRLWYNLVDGKNLKFLPENLESLLTPIALAYLGPVPRPGLKRQKTFLCSKL